MQSARHAYDAQRPSLTCRRLLDEVVVTAPTIGSNVEEVVYKNIRFLMWDIAGQEAARATWSAYYSATHVCAAQRRGTLPRAE